MLTAVVSPEHISSSLAVTVAFGFTVTVTLSVLIQAPVLVVAVMLYCTVPATLLLGLLNTWAMLAPVPLLAPVMLPVIVPTVHV